jgi:exosortase J
MFTPDFGMFIAPGCDGIRGSVTMGLVALIAGYVYRFRWYVNAVLVIAAILLGYVFNLARLCLLVLYYAIALHFNSLQDKAKNADYLIGALLFLCATLLLFAAIHGLREKTGSPAVSEGDSDQLPNYAFHGSYTKLISMGLVCAFGCASLIRLHEKFPYSGTAAYSAGERFPAALGNYKLVRSWNETMNDGTMVYAWAQYIPVQGGTSIAIGISPVLGWHDPLMCHFIRGENPLWQGQLVADTAGKIPVDLSSAFYDDGVTRSVEASTVCSGGMCGEFATTRTHFGFIYTRPSSRLLFTDDPEQAIPILLRAETIDDMTPADTTRSRLTADLRAFIATVRLDDLVRPYSR